MIIKLVTIDGSNEKIYFDDNAINFLEMNNLLNTIIDFTSIQVSSDRIQYYVNPYPGNNDFYHISADSYIDVIAINLFHKSEFLEMILKLSNIDYGKEFRFNNLPLSYVLNIPYAVSVDICYFIDKKNNKSLFDNNLDITL